MASDTRLELLKHIAKVEEAFPLQELNPLRAGGIADFYVQAHDTIELVAAVKAAIDVKIPYVVVGQGKGILFSDGGFPGLVVHNKTSGIAVAREKSQIVVDSGMPLQQLITAAANIGLGGLTHLYGQTGTVGGSVYANIGQDSRPILSSVRYLTMLMPPARLDKEATIVRFRSEWMEREDSATKLLYLKATKGMEEPQPIILTVLFQMTNIRSDEVRIRLQNQSQKHSLTVPTQTAMGPIFMALPDVRVEDLLLGAEVAKLGCGNVQPHRRHPNYITVKGGAVRSADIRQLISEMQLKVQAKYSMLLSCRYEFLGAW